MINNLLKIFVFCLILIVPASWHRISGQQLDNQAPAGLRMATFDVDATPPVGSQLAYDPVAGQWDLGLRARGLVLMGSDKPIVICSVDWIGIANDSQDEFKRALAEAAGTIPDRVAVHTIHVHDAPMSDFGAEQLLKKAGIGPVAFESSFQHQVIQRIADAIRIAIQQAQPVTHIGTGTAAVSQVASNRRILGADGRVRATRWTTCKDSALRAEPEGLIDPMVSVVSFWNDHQPIAVLSFYATHPQSYYRTGLPNPDFPGVARFYRQLAVPEALPIHFNGAGANIGVGKYNDGSHENRGLLAERLADGMRRAWENTVKEAVTPPSVVWNIEPVDLPPAADIDSLREQLPAHAQDTIFLTNNTSKMVWLDRCRAGKKINIGCLSVGHARMLFLPGEMFVEYQLEAKAVRPDLFVAMAAYGDYGPNYICTDQAYRQGGYEAGAASGVAPGTEKIIMDALKKLLQH